MPSDREAAEATVPGWLMETPGRMVVNRAPATAVQFEAMMWRSDGGGGGLDTTEEHQRESGKEDAFHGSLL
jgi:hypothetical protein